MLRRMQRRPFGLGRLTAGLPQAFWLLWVGTIINRLGGFVVPFLSLYLTSERGVTVAEAGLIVAAFGAGSFAAQLAGGELADRLGRRPVLLMSLLGAPPLALMLGL
jgi:MFS family permease